MDSYGGSINFVPFGDCCHRLGRLGSISPRLVEQRFSASAMI
jgi:hypothetical protein